MSCKDTHLSTYLATYHLPASASAYTSPAQDTSLFGTPRCHTPYQAKHVSRKNKTNAQGMVWYVSLQSGRRRWPKYLRCKLKKNQWRDLRSASRSRRSLREVLTQACETLAETVVSPSSDKALFKEQHVEGIVRYTGRPPSRIRSAERRSRFRVVHVQSSCVSSGQAMEPSD